MPAATATAAAAPPPPPSGPSPSAGPVPMPSHHLGNGSSHTHNNNIHAHTHPSPTVNGASPVATAANSTGPMPPPTKNTSHVPCKFFRQHACQAGNSCPFSHSLDPIPPCKYFLKGNCKFGAKCANQHMITDRRRPSMPSGQHPGSIMAGQGSASHAQSPPPSSASPLGHLSRANASPATPSLLSIHARHGQLGPHPIPAGARPGGDSRSGMAGSYDTYDIRTPSGAYSRPIAASAPYGGVGIDINNRFPGSPPDSLSSAFGYDAFDSPRIAVRGPGSVPVPDYAGIPIGIGSASVSSPPLPRGGISVGRSRDRFAASQQAFMSASVGSGAPGSIGMAASPLANASSGKYLIVQESADADSDIDEILLNQQAAAEAAVADGLPEYEDSDSAVLDDYDSDSDFRAEAFGVRRGSLLAIPLTPTSRTSFSSARQSISMMRPTMSPRPVPGSVRSVSLSTPLSAARFGIGSYSGSTIGGSPAIPMTGSSLRIGSPNASSPLGPSVGSPSRFSQFFSPRGADLSATGSTGTAGPPLPALSTSVSAIPTSGPPTWSTPTSLRVSSAVVGSPLRNQQFPTALGATNANAHAGAGMNGTLRTPISAAPTVILSVSKLAISTSYLEQNEDRDLVAGLPADGPVGRPKSDIDDARSRSTDEEGALFDME